MATVNINCDNCCSCIFYSYSFSAVFIIVKYIYYSKFIFQLLVIMGALGDSTIKSWYLWTQNNTYPRMHWVRYLVMS